MNNQLLIPDDKIYIYPSDWKQPVRIQFENGSTINTVNYGDSHHTIQFDKWVDYDTIVTDETYKSLSKTMYRKIFQKKSTVYLFTMSVTVRVYYEKIYQ